MKKISIVFVCLTLVLSTVGLTTAVNNDTIYVDDDGGADYTTIQEAIDAASDGDTVFVYSGVYHEHVSIKSKSITLQGENKETTIIDAEGDGDALLIDTTHDVIVSDFTFQNSGVGWVETGVYVHESSNCIIKKSIMQDCGYGITVFLSSDILVTNNIMIDNEDGFMLSDSENVDVKRNTIENNLYNGIFLNYCKSGSIVENNFINNKRHFGFYGIYFVDITANYWEQFIYLKYQPIIGLLFTFIPIPGVIFDWNPAREPYDIDGGI